MNKLSQQASGVQPEVTECGVITVEDEPMDVGDDSFLARLEETLKDYITKMEVGECRFDSSCHPSEWFNNDYF